MARTVLPNGLTVVSDAMPHVETVAVGTWIAAGSRSETADEHGIAHFLEHMAFKGTRRRSAREISEVIEAVGGEINAATSVENTAYHARMLADDLPLAIDVIADILTEPQFAPDEVGREANVILQEIGAAEDVPEDRAFDAFPEAAFAGQPIGRRILGSRDAVSSVSSAALRRFFGTHYAAGQMTVAAAGKVEHDAFVSLVEDAFAAVPMEPAREHAPAAYTGGVFADAFEGSECQYVLGFEGRAATTSDATTAHITAMVMGGGLSSRLFQSLREERGLCYDTSAFHWAFQDCGLFGVHVAAAADEMREAVPVLIDELDAALGSITDEETDRAKAQMKAGLLMSRESCAARMSHAARQSMLYGRLVPPSERVAEIEAVTAADVRDMLAKILASAPTIVTVGPTDTPTPDDLTKRFGSAAPALAGGTA